MRFARTAVPAALGAVVVAGLGIPPALAATDAAPDATITGPAVNDQVFPVGTVTFTGTATDDLGVRDIGIAFQDRVTKNWYRPDGTFGAYYRFPVDFSAPGAMAVTWSYSWKVPVNGAYLAQVVARDTAGHADSVLPFRRFNADDRAPDTAVSQPKGGIKVRKGTTVTFAGTATDNFGVGFLNVGIENAATRRWLRPGGGWGSYYAFRKPVDHSGATSTPWLYTYRFGSTGTFRVQFGAVDLAGQVDPAQPYRQVTVTR